MPKLPLGRENPQLRASVVSLVSRAQLCELDVARSCTSRELRAAVSAKVGIAGDQALLLWGGRPLGSGETRPLGSVCDEVRIVLARIASSPQEAPLVEGQAVQRPCVLGSPVDVNVCSADGGDQLCALRIARSCKAEEIRDFVCCELGVQPIQMVLALGGMYLVDLQSRPLADLADDVDAGATPRPVQLLVTWIALLPIDLEHVRCQTPLE